MNRRVRVAVSCDLVAADEDTEAGVDLAAKGEEAEEARRAVHRGIRHQDKAVRGRPPRILADGENPPVPLFYLLWVVVLETGQIAGVGEGMAGNSQPFCGLLAGLVVKVRLNPQVHCPNTGPIERETLLGDGGIDVDDVAFANGSLDQLPQAERAVVGDGENTSEEAVRVQQEGLQVLARDARGPAVLARPALGDKFAQLFHSNLIHLTYSLHLLSNSSTSGAIAKHITANNRQTHNWP